MPHPLLPLLPVLILCEWRGGLGHQWNIGGVLIVQHTDTLDHRDRVRPVRTGRASSVTNSLARVDRPTDVVECSIMCNSVCYSDSSGHIGLDDHA